MFVDWRRMRRKKKREEKREERKKKREEKREERKEKRKGGFSPARRKAGFLKKDKNLLENTEEVYDGSVQRIVQNLCSLGV